MKVFSFCIFGNKKKYCLGLCKNLEIINKKLPDFYIWIYGGNDVPSEYIEKYKSYNNVKYIALHTAETISKRDPLIGSELNKIKMELNIPGINFDTENLDKENLDIDKQKASYFYWNEILE